MAGIAIAAILLLGVLVGEAAAKAGLRQRLAFLPIAENLAVFGIDDACTLARHDLGRHVRRGLVAVLRADFLGFILDKACLPLRGGVGPAGCDGGIAAAVSAWGGPARAGSWLRTPPNDTAVSAAAASAERITPLRMGLTA